MSADYGRNSADLVTNVCKAFEAMRVPAGPAQQETIDALWRACSAAQTDEDPRRGQSSSNRPRSRLARLTVAQRIAVGGIGLSTIAALAMLALVLGGSRQLSAMERMARLLNEVKSYRYAVSSETITTEQDPKRRTIWRETGTDIWRAPDAFRGAERIVEIKTTDSSGEPSEKVLEDFVEIFPPGGMGIFIDHKRKTYFLSRFEPIGSTTYPLAVLKMIREDAPPPTRDLGSRQIGGRAARGYQINLTTGDPPRRHDWEVWLDAQTDLPLEIGYQVDDQRQPRTTTVFRLNDFHWNEELDPGLFKATPPEGYREVPPPKLQQPAAPSDGSP